MCGIAGKFYLHHEPKPESLHNDLKRMIRAIEHRGPDDQGFEVWPNGGFGQARLAIIDLSPAGHQPMSYDRERYWITFNGEIYNYQLLRSQLQKKKHVFRTQTDTEVILAAYKEWGSDCVSHFRGMFAFAIFDRPKNLIFCARDRLGKKPFKYYLDDSVFLFASELKAFRTQKEVLFSPDTEALRQYVYWGFVPSPLTGFEKIQKLPASHTLILDLKSKTTTIRRYWQLSESPLLIDYEQAKHKLREEMEESVRLRLIADVPIGAFLSGGIDSTLIVGLMSKIMEEPVKTFTVSFRGWENDESKIAEKTARVFGADHTTLHVTPDVAHLLPTITKAYEEPFGDSSAIPSYLVSREARKHVTVALNGDGGDEGFFGYSNYQNWITLQQLSFLRLPSVITQKLLSPLGWNRLHPSMQKIQRISDLLARDSYEGYALLARGYLNAVRYEDLTKNEIISEVNLLRRYLPHPHADVGQSLLSLDSQTTLPDGLLPKVDIASMQHALEVRSPLLDHKILEMAMKMPLAWKYQNGVTKHMLRDAFADVLPAHVIHEPKRGFVMPIDSWIRGKLRPQFRSVFENPKHPVFAFLDYETCRQVFRSHSASTADFSSILWRMYMLALWIEQNE